MAYDYDITVIGGGPGGYVAAIRAAKEGKRVCLVERENLGGVCLNEGCIPTKTLLKSANLLSEIRHAGDFGIVGIDASAARVDMAKLQARRAKVVATLVGGVKGLVRGNKIALVEASASFVDAHTIEAGGKRITSEYFIIATGSEVFMPPFIAMEGKNTLLTSREALLLDKVPASIAIIGGGVIGVEFASLLNKLGSKVTVLELLPDIMPMVDREVSGLAKKRLEKDGITFRMQAKVTKVKDNAVYYELGGNAESVRADAVLMAVGRVPRTDGLNAEKIGIEFDRKAVKTDSRLRTSVPNIYCIGDANGKVMLAHVASHEGIMAVEDICGKHAAMHYDRVPSCIYLDPEIACIGLTEDAAKADGRAVKVGRFTMAGNGKSLVEGDTDGLVKVIVDAQFGEILGLHMYGKHATDMISELSVAMTAEATADEIIESIHPHPTVSEAIPEAFMAAYGRAIHSL
ncbi:MAG: dihydrolipoyl dehydrogenase [Planctomycetaceae bacterium]|nr:dihydrolipoyl dehydrogenase [Planctomycetaceae bacterium]